MAKEIIMSLVRNGWILGKECCLDRSRTFLNFFEFLNLSRSSKPYEKMNGVILVFRDNRSSPVISFNLELLDRGPGFSFLGLVDHVLKLKVAQLTAKEQTLALHFFPIVSPGGSADGASAFREIYF
jgi:hypothetical protein